MPTTPSESSRTIARYGLSTTLPASNDEISAAVVEHLAASVRRLARLAKEDGVEVDWRLFSLRVTNTPAGPIGHMSVGQS